MVEGCFEYVVAEVFPVGAGVEQVEVPDFVYHLGGDDGVIGGAVEEEEAAVFLEGAIALFGCPAGFASESRQEAVVEAQGHELAVEVLVEGE